MTIGGAQRPITVLLYSVNGTGLGHLTRLMAIGRWLKILLNGLDLEPRIYFLSCSDADFLLSQQGFPSFKLPSRASLVAASIRGKSADQLIREFAVAALEKIAPDVALIDTFPTGTYDELLPLLGREDVTKVFIFREQRSDYVARVPYQKLLSGFDLLLIPHPEESFELGFQTPPGLQIAWSGPVVFGEPNELWPKSKAHRAVGVRHGKTVIYTSAGGGGDPEAARIFKTILGTVRELPDVHLVVGAGPLSRRAPIRGKGLTWTTFYPISRLFRGFDFAISASGYNSVNEFLYFGLPAILYAQERTADDQWVRASEVAAAGAAIALRRLTPAALRKAIRRMMDPELRSKYRAAAHRLVPVNGARRAAEEVINVALPRLFPGTEFENLELSRQTA